MGARISAFFTSCLLFDCEIVRKFPSSTNDSIVQDVEGYLCAAGLRPSDHMKNSPNKYYPHLTQLIKKSPLKTRSKIFEQLGVKFPSISAIIILVAFILALIGIALIGIALLVYCAITNTCKIEPPPPSTTSLPTEDPLTSEEKSRKLSAVSKPITEAGNERNATSGTKNCTARSELTITTAVGTAFPSTVLPRAHSSIPLPPEDPVTSEGKTRESSSFLKPVTEFLYTSRQERFGTSLYNDFLKVPAPPDEPRCEVESTLDEDELGIRLDLHFCPENQYRYTTATINNLENVPYLANVTNLVGLKIIAPHDPEASKIPRRASKHTLGIRVLVLKTPGKKQHRTGLLQNIATYDIPNLEVLVFHNFYISKRDIKYLSTLLNKGSITFVSFYNTELCEDCAALLDQLIDMKIDHLHFILTNPHVEVANRTKHIVNTLQPHLRELRWNVSLTEDEFEDYMAKLGKLQVVELTVNVDGKPSWTLPTTNAEELHIHLIAKTKLPHKKTVIHLGGSFLAGVNYAPRVYFYVKAEDFEISEDDQKWCAEFSNMNPGGILKITCSKD